MWSKKSLTNPPYPIRYNNNVDDTYGNMTGSDFLGSDNKTTTNKYIVNDTYETWGGSVYWKNMRITTRYESDKYTLELVSL